MNRRAFSSSLGAILLLGAALPVSADIIAGADGVGVGPILHNFQGTKNLLTRDFYAFSPTFYGGVRVAAGDVNGDGVADIVVGAGPGGGPQVKVFDGVTGGELYSFFAFTQTFAGGVYVAAGDVNGDGDADVIAGAGPGGTPHVKVFSGATGNVLADFDAFANSFTGGVRVAAGDVNGDGKADIIAGAGPGGGPQVKVFDGTNTANVLQSFFAYSAAFTGGIFVAAGDVNGDGKADIITGPDSTGAPVVTVFSGVDASTLQSFNAFDVGFTGGVRVAAGDYNGDGALDIEAGAGSGSGVVMVFDSNANLIATLPAFFSGYTGGVFVAMSPFVAGALDIFTPPVVVVKGKASVRTPRSMFKCSGSASGAAGIAKVEYSAEGGKFKAAHGTTKWSFQLKLNTGRNVIKIRAVDTKGQYSPVKQVVVVRKAPRGK